MGRDRFILSKGHGAMALFHVLARRGFILKKCFAPMEKMGVFLAPPAPDHLPGIEAATGSLGTGCQWFGIVLAARIQKLSYNVYDTWRW